MKRHCGYGNLWKHWVVDLYNEKFFDTVDHYVLMSRVARKVTDKMVLCLVG